MRVALLGGGTISRLLLEHGRRSGIPGVQLVAIAGRTAGSRGVALAQEFGIPHWPTTLYGEPPKPPPAGRARS